MEDSIAELEALIVRQRNTLVDLQVGRDVDFEKLLRTGHDVLQRHEAASGGGEAVEDLAGRADELLRQVHALNTAIVTAIRAEQDAIKSKLDSVAAAHRIRRDQSAGQAPPSSIDRWA